MTDVGIVCSQYGHCQDIPMIYSNMDIVKIEYGKNSFPGQPYEPLKP